MSLATSAESRPLSKNRTAALFSSNPCDRFSMSSNALGRPLVTVGVVSDRYR